VPTDAAGVERISYRLMDGQKVANIVFTDVRVGADALLGDCMARGLEVMTRRCRRRCRAGRRGAGIMGQLNAKTLEYTKTREQFGVPIGSFQALQHRMVDTFMSYEQAKSMLYRAVCALDNGDDDARARSTPQGDDRTNAASISSRRRFSCTAAWGITDELDIAHYAKRLMMINATFGDGDYHQSQFNALSYGSAGRRQRRQYERRRLIIAVPGPPQGGLFASGVVLWR
jgi:alkylation response protein AidB-like acyl-CoA dehydrogenase